MRLAGVWHAIKTDKPIVELTLYAEQPQLEIVTVGPTSALIPAGEDFELQCTVRNNGLVSTCNH